MCIYPQWLFIALDIMKVICKLEHAEDMHNKKNLKIRHTCSSHTSRFWIYHTTDCQPYLQKSKSSKHYRRSMFQVTSHILAHVTACTTVWSPPNLGKIFSYMQPYVHVYVLLLMKKFTGYCITHCTCRSPPPVFQRTKSIFQRNGLWSFAHQTGN